MVCLSGRRRRLEEAPPDHDGARAGRMANRLHETGAVAGVGAVPRERSIPDLSKREKI